MTDRLHVVRTPATLHRMIGRFRDDGETIALVPTMGALHEGHLSLVRMAARRADRVIVSIFVNPTQFAPNEDFGSYPRTFATDRARLARERVDIIWAPSVAVMYPAGASTRVVPEGPATVGLEDAFRPHFFAGVATVVTKLFMQCSPDFAFFGEKDYQQLKVVTRMAADLSIPVRIVGGPTMREKDGLAMSSRNAYLSAAERAMAPTLYRVLRTTAARIAAGKLVGRAVAAGRKAIAQSGFKLDYFEARDAETLRPVRSAAPGRLRLLVAARLGKTRLIDNIGA